MINKKSIENVSTKPGVYFWKDVNNNIIYVGKAKNLRARMAQYFDINMQNSYKTSTMLSKIASFETTVFETEAEAFIYERRCISKYKPFYNVLLPTQANFPYICISKNANNLSIKLENKFKKAPNAIYYGPLIKSSKYTKLIKYLNHLLKSKNGLILKKMNPDDIETAFLKAKKILKFDKDFRNNLLKKISWASENEEYQLAKDYKDILDLVYSKENNQNIILEKNENFDVFGFYNENGKIFISILHYRFSNLIKKSDFQFEISGFLEDFISNFIEEYYSINQIPNEILLPVEYQNIFINKEIKNLINFKNNEVYKKILNIAYENAKNDILNKIIKLEKENNLQKTIDKLGVILKQDATKFVIFDNSFMSNVNQIVGGCCFYENGKLNTSLSRAYILTKNEFKKDDTFFMQQSAQKFLKNNSELINLIFVDGSISQINAVKKAINDLNISVPIFGLVKNSKHTFEKIIDSNNNVIEFQDTEVFNFLTIIQNKVDKFAKEWFNKRHSKDLFFDSIYQIKGIGYQTINKLLNHFGTYEAIFEAGDQELSKITSKNIAKKIRQNLN